MIDLYNAIPIEMANQVRETSERLAPGFQLEKWITDCSKLFVGTRYPYEANSVQGIDLDVLKLAPHLDQVLEEMIRQPASARLQI